MGDKRKFNHQEEGDGSGPSNQEQDASNARIVIQEYTLDQLKAALEPFMRQLVQDELQRGLTNFFGTSSRFRSNEHHSHSTTSLQLRFQTKLRRSYFTGNQIKAEDNSAIELVLFDASSNKIVSDGRFSLLTIRIVPLDDDFPADDDEDLAGSVFNAKVIGAREGRRPLLMGTLEVRLKEGVALLDDLVFTDNSSWRRSRKFRLGAKALKLPAGVRIREARSGAFIMKDQRGESYEKHHPPRLDDEIWRLEKIAKDGALHKKLASYRILTLRHFLQVYATNGSALCTLLGGPNNNNWKAIIKHAKACVLDDNVYKYSGMGEIAGGIALLFNSVLEVVGATFDGANHKTMDQLEEYQKTIVEGLKQQFFNELDGRIPLDDLSMVATPVLAANLHDIFQMPISQPYDGFLQDESTSWQANVPNNQNIDLVSSDFDLQFPRNGLDLPEEDGARFGPP